MKLNVMGFSRRFIPLFAGLFLVLSNISESSAQVTDQLSGPTPIGMQKSNPYSSIAFSNIESINLFSGKVCAIIPLVSVRGRGSFGYTLTVPSTESAWVTRYDPPSPVPNPNGWAGHMQ